MAFMSLSLMACGGHAPLSFKRPRLHRESGTHSPLPQGLRSMTLSIHAHISGCIHLIRSVQKVLGPKSRGRALWAHLLGSHTCGWSACLQCKRTGGPLQIRCWPV